MDSLIEEDIGLVQQPGYTSNSVHMQPIPIFSVSCETGWEVVLKPVSDLQSLGKFQYLCLFHKLVSTQTSSFKRT